MKSMTRIALVLGLLGGTGQAAVQGVLSVDEIVEGLMAELVEWRTQDEWLSDYVKSKKEPHNALRFLQDLNLELMTFNDRRTGDESLGFSYGFDKTMMRSSSTAAWTLNFESAGNVAFDQAANPDDFLNTSLGLRFFGSRHGESAEVDGQPTAIGAATLSAARLFAKGYSRMSELRDDPGFADFASDFQLNYAANLPLDIYWQGTGRIAMEHNQDFSSRQALYGLELGATMRSWSQDGLAAKANFFDYPAAAIRWLTGMDDGWTPSGKAWPGLVVGIDQVQPDENRSRRTVGDTDSFSRFRLEAGMKSSIGEYDDKPVWLNVGYRYFQEFGSSSAVEDAGLDQFNHVQVAIDFPTGWSLSYSAGRLPLDVQDDSVFSLGFKTSL